MPDLVLCDNDLRDRQHRSLCEVLKHQSITQAIPVLLLLNDDEDETILEGLGCGANGYISKPFNVKELDLLIRNNLRAVVTLKDKLAGIQVTTGLTALPRRNKEQEFVLKFAAFVNEQYSDQHLTADGLAQQMNCSRSQPMLPPERASTTRIILAACSNESGA